MLKHPDQSCPNSNPTNNSDMTQNKGLMGSASPSLELDILLGKNRLVWNQATSQSPKSGYASPYSSSPPTTASSDGGGARNLFGHPEKAHPPRPSPVDQQEPAWGVAHASEQQPFLFCYPRIEFAGNDAQLAASPSGRGPLPRQPQSAGADSCGFRFPDISQPKQNYLPSAPHTLLEDTIGLGSIHGSRGQSLCPALEPPTRQSWNFGAPISHNQEQLWEHFPSL